MSSQGYYLDLTKPFFEFFRWAEGLFLDFAAVGIDRRRSAVEELCDLPAVCNSEPDYGVYDFENYRYCDGPALALSNMYPQMYSRAFYEGQKAMGQKSIVNLERCAWVGSQKYNQVIWNGDVQSTWECFRTSVCEGLNMGIAGIPWWTTDIGGFMYGDVRTEEFK